MTTKRRAHLKRPIARTHARKPAKPRAARAPSAPAALPGAIGTQFGGGTVLGRFFNVEKPYALIGAQKDVGELSDQQYHDSYERIAGAGSYYDGMANTEAMAKAGSKVAKWARGLRIGGHVDWYLPSRGEALLAKAAEITGAEAFEKRAYWTSTQHAGDADYAWIQFFGDGGQVCYCKDYRFLARAVRRVPI